MDKPVKIFISYSRHDEELVRPLAGFLGLAAEGGVFLDLDSIRPGDDWRAAIERGIEGASVIVFCWCCAASMSEYIAYEIGVAMRYKEKPLVPGSSV
jgi:hypothetical protein